MTHLIKHTTKAHYEKYKKLAEDNGVTLKNSKIFPNKERLVELFKNDENLNNIPLGRFDSLFHAGRMYHRKTWPRSLAENTCMYKHLLIYEIIEAKPIFEED